MKYYRNIGYTKKWVKASSKQTSTTQRNGFGRQSIFAELDASEKRGIKVLDCLKEIRVQRWRSEVQPLVSICCATYNHENYIRDAFEGFLMQMTTFPVEIIVNDDASSDDTRIIIKEYRKRYPELINVIFHQENQYSNGIDAEVYLFADARGKYIALCEGDDYWTDPLKLQKQIQFLENHAAFSVCVGG